MKTIKVFISQPMNGLKLKEIQDRRDYILNNLSTAIATKSGLSTEEFKIEVVNPITRKNKPENADRLWYLGQAISDMDRADVVIFDESAVTKARGCFVEHVVARSYNKPMYLANTSIIGEIAKYLR